MNAFYGAGQLQAPSSNQVPVSKQAWLSRPDIMEDFDTQMEKEKARLNRFISVKEQNNKSEVERMEKVRKDIIKQEQRFNKNIKELN